MFLGLFVVLVVLDHVRLRLFVCICVFVVVSLFVCWCAFGCAFVCFMVGPFDWLFCFIVRVFVCRSLCLCFCRSLCPPV